MSDVTPDGRATKAALVLFFGTALAAGLVAACLGLTSIVPF